MCRYGSETGHVRWSQMKLHNQSNLPEKYVSDRDRYMIEIDVFTALCIKCDRLCNTYFWAKRLDQLCCSLPGLTHKLTK